jgi:hypothetical protein
VLGRALGFADPAVVKLLQENFVPVVGDDWYQRRRKDDVGRFFRKVVDQTWKAGDWESQGGGGNNRQGIYCFTASGQMLTEMKNVGGMPREVERLLQAALRGWNALPAEARRPGVSPAGASGGSRAAPVPARAQAGRGGAAVGR